MSPSRNDNGDQSELDDLVPGPPPEIIPEVEPAQDAIWVQRGKRSGKVSLGPGASVVRNHQVVGGPPRTSPTGPGDPCVEPGCPSKDGSHQFHLRVVKIDGQFYGPDAPHMRDLIAGGLIRNTVECAERLQREVEIGNIRGITPTATCPWCKSTVERNAKGDLSPICPEGHRTHLPELAPRTTAQIRHEWARDLAGGVEAVKARELESRRNEVADLRDAVKAGNAELVEALRQVVAERGDGHGGK